MILRFALLPFVLTLLFPLCSYGEEEFSIDVLQAIVDEAEDGAHIVPPAGIYHGTLTISKPLILDGKDLVTIDAGGSGSVIILNTDGATVRNFTLINSGDQHNSLDAGVQIRGNYNIVRDNRMMNTLFGVDLSQSNNNIIEGNNVHSKELEMGVRGDGVRLWYSNDNRVTNNYLCNCRDFVVWYSENNTLSNNEVCHSRYGMHFMYSKYNLVEDNYFHHISVGIFLMYSDGVVVRNNTISHGLGPTSIGIGFKEASDMTISNNTIFYAGRGMYLDVSPLQPDVDNRIYSNRISYCSTGITFHNDWVGNKIRDNIFSDNFVQVGVNTRATVKRNEWDGNYWDDYQGFDRDNNGVGDTPYKKWLFADRVWLDVPFASFYKGSPVLSLLDFIERLAPFSEPLLLLEDHEPLMKGERAVITDSERREKVEKAGSQTERYDPFGLSGD
jgi:nitrous oxidase accessory protein